jgi:hypothetical protein
MGRELDWLGEPKKKEEKKTETRISSEELDELLKEEEPKEIGGNKDKEELQEINLDDLEDSWKINTLSKTEESQDERKTGVSCILCGGEIIERTCKISLLEGTEGIYSPGGRRFVGYREPKYEGYHCSICKIMFFELPPKDLLKAKSES